LKRQDLRKALLHKSAKFAFFGSGLAYLPEPEKFNAVSLTDRHRIVQMSPITTCLQRHPKESHRRKLKGLAYFGQFMGQARDQQWGIWRLAYCASQRPKNLDVLVLLREPHLSGYKTLI
jgi:hypothetical protein